MSFQGTASLSTDEFERRGHPGKWKQAIEVSSSMTMEFTGSNYGAGTILVEQTATGTITLTGGGTLDIAHLASSTPQMFDLSIRKVAVTNHHVHVLIRNFPII